MKINLLRLLVAHLLFMICIPLLDAQDLIIFKTGEEMQVKVTEITTEQVRYQKWTNLEGPSYLSGKSEIFMIKYANGTKDVFTQNVTNTPSANTNRSTDAVLEIARKLMADIINRESKGALRLIDFKKENGIHQNIFGQQLYELSYILVVEAQRDFWKQSKGLFESNWYWDSYYVESGQADIYAQSFQNIQSKHYPVGSQIQIQGKIPFMETDNGWMAADVNSFSNGYDNNSSRDLRMGGTISGTNEPSASSPKPPPSTNPAPATSKIPKTPPSEDTYKGELVDGKRNGKGTMHFKNGDYYDGEWKNDTIQGYGEMQYAEGMVYKGNWVNGRKHGKGKQTFKDGSSFEGTFDMDSYANSTGTVTWADKRKYVGPLKDHQMHGRGTVFHANGKIEKDGTFENGKLTGQGTLYAFNEEGDFFWEGQFRDGDLNGQGTLTILYKNGDKSIRNGEFRNDKLYNGTHDLLMHNGDKFKIVYTNGVEGKKTRVKD